MILMSDLLVTIMNLFKEASLWTNIIIGLITGLLTSVGGLFVEYKYNIINRIKKWWAHFRNKQAEVAMNIRYKPKKDFEDIKRELKNSFLKEYSNYDILNESKSKIFLSFDVFTIKIIHDEFNEIFIDLSKTGCGINDLKDKLDVFLSALDKINRKKGLFSNLVSCEISVYLPYIWSYIKVYNPKGFELNNYLIEMKKSEGYKTNVEVRLNSISASVKSIEEISFLLQKLL